MMIGSSEHLLGSLNSVGKKKAVGYLPIRTLEALLGYDLKDMKIFYTRQGLDCLVIKQKFSCVESGAFFVYRDVGVREIIENNRNLLNRLKWMPRPISVLRKIGAVWHSDPEVLMLIRELFGEAIE